MKTIRRSSERGVSLLEVLIAMLLLSGVAMSQGVLLRSLGLLGVSQFSNAGYERPARLRTLSMEYIQAEMEYLRNRSYMELRNAGVCEPTPGLPVALADARRVAGSYIDANEPRLPALLAAADILLTNEPVIGVTPDGCAPRRVSVIVYLHPSDVPASIGGGGVVFMRAETVRSLR